MIRDRNWRLATFINRGRNDSTRPIMTEIFPAAIPRGRIRPYYLFSGAAIKSKPCERYRRKDKKKTKKDEKERKKGKSVIALLCRSSPSVGGKRKKKCPGGGVEGGGGSGKGGRKS